MIRLDKHFTLTHKMDHRITSVRSVSRHGRSVAFCAAVPEQRGAI